MKLNALLVAGALALACLAGPVFAQAVAAVAPVVVVSPTPLQQLLGEIIQGVTAIAVAAVPIVAGAAVMWLRSRWKLAGVLVSQAMLDKLVLSIQNQIRAEAEKVQGKVFRSTGDPAAAATVLTPAQKQDIAAAVAPKIAADFKETLKHFGKDPASLKDMVLGHIEPALKPNAPVVSGDKQPVAIPAVMARS